MTYFEALAWTFALELPVVLAIGRYWSLGLGRSVAAGLFASAITHPFAWWAAVELPPVHAEAGWYAIEIAVGAIEALFYRWFLAIAWTRAATLSIAANVVSAFVGRLLT